MITQMPEPGDLLEHKDWHVIGAFKKGFEARGDVHWVCKVVKYGYIDADVDSDYLYRYGLVGARINTGPFTDSTASCCAGLSSVRMSINT